MASATARAPQPGNEEGRPVAGRPSDFVNSNKQDHTLETYRVQRLINIAGMSPAIAAASAPFIFGGAA